MTVSAIERAAGLLREGRPVLLYDADGREEETDLFFAAEHATPEAVEALRTQAGGLVFLAVAPPVASALGLPFLQDLFQEAADRHPVLRALIPNDIRYDTRSSFSLTINHRQTFTGITDNDRSLTIREFARTALEALEMPGPRAQRIFGERFRAPGHVHLCVGAEGLLARRRGHTELAVALAEVAGVTPVLVGAEMMQPGTALPRAKAEAWARAHGTVLLSGADVERAWANLKGTSPHASVSGPR